MASQVQDMQPCLRPCNWAEFRSKYGVDPMNTASEQELMPLVQQRGIEAMKRYDVAMTLYYGLDVVLGGADFLAKKLASQQGDGPLDFTIHLVGCEIELMFLKDIKKFVMDEIERQWSARLGRQVKLHVVLFCAPNNAASNIPPDVVRDILAGDLPPGVSGHEALWQDLVGGGGSSRLPFPDVAFCLNAGFGGGYVEWGGALELFRDQRIPVIATDYTAYSALRSLHLLSSAYTCANYLPCVLNPFRKLKGPTPPDQFHLTGERELVYQNYLFGINLQSTPQLIHTYRDYNSPGELLRVPKPPQANEVVMSFSSDSRKCFFHEKNNETAVAESKSPAAVEVLHLNSKTYMMVHDCIFDADSGRAAAYLLRGFEATAVPLKALPDDLRLRSGTLCRIVGLQSEDGKKHNNRTGMIVDFREEKGRYIVHFGGVNDTVSVKIANIVV
ncbi:unnamed protein product [Amoebophrya sp. A120]|nr:unnamed protein product [Amoebophrya sp. A120]|eukprot:GSA120T00004207001.1